MDLLAVDPQLPQTSSGVIDGVLVLSSFLGVVLLDIFKGGAKWYVALTNALKKGLDQR